MSSEDVVLLVELRVRKEHRDELVQLLTAMIERTRIAPECITYELFARSENESILYLFQTWGTRQALEVNWQYTDLPQINAASHLLVAPLQAKELHRLL